MYRACGSDTIASAMAFVLAKKWVWCMKGATRSWKVSSSIQELQAILHQRVECATSVSSFLDESPASACYLH